jgi:hypothetical protein
MKKQKELPIEKVIVKISSCNKCQGIVRVAIEHTMDTKSKTSFGKEVVKYNLSVKSIPLIDYKKMDPDWCECE